MTRAPIVSVVTPCYNGEATIGRLLDSVLDQTHHSIDLVLVDDGSTDGTADVVRHYEPTLRAELSNFTFVQQSNQGLGGAINVGLRHVTGDYLCWPDADDYLEPTSVADRLAVLRAHPEYAVVTSDFWLRDERDLSTIGRASRGVGSHGDPWQFEHLLRGESIFAPGTHMVCMRRFDETHPGRSIYPARRGQNWQMLLPLYHRYKRFFLDVPLYNYVVSPGSMSRSDETLAQHLERVAEHDLIIERTLDSMSMSAEDRQRAELLVRERHARAVIRAGRQFRDRAALKDGYRALRESGQMAGTDRLRRIRSLFA